MKKILLRILFLACLLFVLPILSLVIFVCYGDYQESRNDFTVAQVCQLKSGMNIDDALDILGNPAEYHTYNFSNVYSGQYRNVSKGYFLEIAYTQGEGIMEGLSWGRGRTQTVEQSGICSKN